jgi:hypothetical protein
MPGLTRRCRRRPRARRAWAPESLAGPAHLRGGVQWVCAGAQPVLRVIVRRFSEAGLPYHVAHFHAYYQDGVGIFSVDPVEMIAGSLPTRQRRLVEAWAELRQQELRTDWERLQEGRRPAPIEPLR